MSGAVILFDGVCNLCNSSVNFIIDRDPTGHFKFAALQSDAAAALLAPHGGPRQAMDSIILLSDGHAYERSAAALRIARRLRFPWSLAWVFIVIPWPLRDLVYAAIAKRRYAWFGKQEQCRVPSPELRGRFL